MHRIGRTARAGASGKAVSLACEDYVDGLEAIETNIGFKLPHDIPDETLLVRPLPPSRREMNGTGGPDARRRRRGRRPRGFAVR